MNIKKKIELIEEDDKTTDEHILHQLLELAMAITGRGNISDDYTKFIEFPIGETIIVSDPYYGTVQIEEGTDLESAEIKKLTEEIKKRLLLFDKKISTIREQAATEVFDKQLKNIER